MKRNKWLYLLVIPVIATGMWMCSDDDDGGDTPPTTVLELSVTDLTFDAKGGTQTFDVTSNAKWALSVPAYDTWCTVSSTGGDGNVSKIPVTVSAYEGVTDRNTNIIVATTDTAMVLRVTQKATDAVLETPDKFDVGQDGGIISVKVKSNLDYEIIIPDECLSWITRAPDTRAMEERTIDFSIAKNEATDTRHGIIVFDGGMLVDTVHVYQAQQNVLVLTDHEYTVRAPDTVLVVELRTNVEYDVTVSDEGKEWIHLAETRAPRKDKVALAIDENPGDRREAKVTFKDKNSSLADEITVSQKSYIPENGDYTEKVAGTKFDMVWVEGGSFIMGGDENNPDCAPDELPAHKVTLSGFYIGKLEVSNELWREVVGKMPYAWGCVGSEVRCGDDYPVWMVTYEAAQVFIDSLVSKTGKAYRLPTEAEWEFAARGGVKSEGHTYSGSDNADSVACLNKYFCTRGSLAPNELGIYDMSGSLSEVCEDWYGEYRGDEVMNPTGPETGDNKVYRGGDCQVESKAALRVTARDHFPWYQVYATCGIRIAIDGNKE